MKLAAWSLAVTALVAALLVPPSIAVFAALVSLIAWAYLFAADHLEHRR